MGKSGNTAKSVARPPVGLSCLVAALPEIYQPIYMHPELSRSASRGCEDRLLHLVDIHATLRVKLGRAVRILDLGCAQGFFSLHLAALGADVHGVDCLDKNIAVCLALSKEHSLDRAVFEADRIEDFINRLPDNRYDLVLGLSVFHHLIHEHGLDYVHQLLDRLAKTVPAGVFEIALRSEPVYWSSSQPENPGRLLNSYSFVHELGKHETHLSAIARPLYFASNQYWYFDNQLGTFLSCASEPHAYAKGTHQGTRRYYSGEDCIVKIYTNDDPSRMEINKQEFLNEVDFLSNPPEEYPFPRLILYGNNNNEMWLVRQKIDGQLLTECFEESSNLDYSKIIDDVLRQLVILESKGFYHNDVRCWNVLIDNNGRAIIIDYGAVTKTDKDCVWPFNLYLSFVIFIREVFDGKVSDPFPIRKPLVNIGALPDKYKNALLHMLATPQAEWSFRKLETYLADSILPLGLDTQSLIEGFFTLLATVEDLDWLQVHEEHQQELLQEQEQRAVAAEAWGHQQEQRAVAAEAWGHQQEQRAISVEADLSLTRTECAVANVRLEILEQDNQRWTAMAEQRLQEMLVLQDKLAQQLLNSQSMQSELILAQARVGELNQSSHHWWTVADRQSKELASLQEQMVQQLAHGQWLQGEWDAARVKVDELNHSSHHWWTVADSLNSDLQAVYASKSWRITLPLRKAANFNNQAVAIFKACLVWIWRLCKKAVKYPLIAMATIVAARPGIKSLVKMFADRTPALKMRLRKFAVDNNVIRPFYAQSDFMHVPPANASPPPAEGISVKDLSEHHRCENVDSLFDVDAISRVAVIIHSGGGK